MSMLRRLASAWLNDLAWLLRTEIHIIYAAYILLYLQTIYASNLDSLNVFCFFLFLFHDFFFSLQISQLKKSHFQNKILIYMYVYFIYIYVCIFVLLLLLWCNFIIIYLKTLAQQTKNKIR